MTRGLFGTDKAGFRHWIHGILSAQAGHKNLALESVVIRAPEHWPIGGTSRFADALLDYRLSRVV